MSDDTPIADEATRSLVEALHGALADDECMAEIAALRAEVAELRSRLDAWMSPSPGGQDNGARFVMSEGQRSDRLTAR